MQSDSKRNMSHEFDDLRLKMKLKAKGRKRAKEGNQYY